MSALPKKDIWISDITVLTVLFLVPEMTFLYQDSSSCTVRVHRVPQCPCNRCKLLDIDKVCHRNLHDKRIENGSYHHRYWSEIRRSLRWDMGLAYNNPLGKHLVPVEEKTE